MTTFYRPDFTFPLSGDSTTSMPEPEPETTAEIFEGNVTTEDATYVTSDIMPSAEYTTESMQEGNMVENTTMIHGIGRIALHLPVNNHLKQI